ncbi:MAG: class I SAM-dependent methyltransferase, partial [Chthoniobacterales bacterium]|nr:class I SAM-dependent methyltransferase [Chthoniobacterales bacterium]
SEPHALSTSAIHRAVLGAIAAASLKQGDYLDVGSGTGELMRLVQRHYSFRPFGCDYTSKLLSVPGLSVETVDLNRQPLPYAANRFALVTCVETIEHLENYRAVIREVYRVLQPGGVAIFSTPNILNLRSRLRYLSSGFYNLFGPLLPGETEVESTRGHLSPVSWFYLAHALLSTGFCNLDVTVDKLQRRSLLAFPFLVGPISVANWFVNRRDRRTYATVDERNAWIVRLMNSPKLLLGRTLIVTAVKPA